MKKIKLTIVHTLLILLATAILYGLTYGIFYGAQIDFLSQHQQFGLSVKAILYLLIGFVCLSSLALYLLNLSEQIKNSIEDEELQRYDGKHTRQH